MADQSSPDPTDWPFEGVFSMMFASAPDAMVLTDTARRVIAANTRAEQMFGYSALDFAALPIRALIAAPTDWAKIEPRFLDTGDLVSPSRICVPVALKSKTGEVFDALVTVTPIAGPDKVVGGASCRFQTVRGSLDNDSANASPYDGSDLRHFARGISHDLKNVFAIISGNTQLATDLARNPKLKRFLAECELASAMGARLADRLTAYAGDLPITPECIKLKAFIAAQLPLLERAAGNGVMVSAVASDEHVEIWVDRSGLENALLNLVENARDAMRSGGRIVIETRAESLPQLDGHNTPNPANRFAAIAVTDTGIGMTPWIAKRAFDPFFTTKAHGNGMGLATVKGFVRQCGGKATLASVPGAGTTVTLVLPCGIKD